MFGFLDRNFVGPAAVGSRVLLRGPAWDDASEQNLGKEGLVVRHMGNASSAGVDSWVAVAIGCPGQTVSSVLQWRVSQVLVLEEAAGTRRGAAAAMAQQMLIKQQVRRQATRALEPCVRTHCAACPFLFCLPRETARVACPDHTNADYYDVCRRCSDF